jgi:hypothetical protein
MSRATVATWNLVVTFEVPEPVVSGRPELAEYVWRGAKGLATPMPTLPDVPLIVIPSALLYPPAAWTRKSPMSFLKVPVCAPPSAERDAPFRKIPHPLELSLNRNMDEAELGWLYVTAMLPPVC